MQYELAPLLANNLAGNGELEVPMPQAGVDLAKNSMKRTFNRAGAPLIFEIGLSPGRHCAAPISFHTCVDLSGLRRSRCSVSQGPNRFGAIRSNSGEKMFGGDIADHWQQGMCHHAAFASGSRSFMSPHD
jgi:hypothetical protein